MENEKEKEIKETKKLYVGNLPYELENEELQELFAPYGTVKNCFVVAGKGFGFCEMSTEEEAEKALKALNETMFQERTLKVNYAIPKRDKRRPF